MLPLEVYFFDLIIKTVKSTKGKMYSSTNNITETSVKSLFVTSWLPVSRASCVPVVSRGSLLFCFDKKLIVIMDREEGSSQADPGHTPLTDTHSQHSITRSKRQWGWKWWASE